MQDIHLERHAGTTRMWAMTRALSLVLSMPSPSLPPSTGMESFQRYSCTGNNIRNEVFECLPATAAPETTLEMKFLNAYRLQLHLLLQARCSRVVPMLHDRGHHLLGVAVSVLWAFGNLADGTILTKFIAEDGTTLVPKWFLMMTDVFSLLQLSAVAVVYLQPTNEVLEGQFADVKTDQYTVRNVAPRLVFRSLSVVAATTIAAMLPFFGDINAVIGAFGFLPLDFVVPSVLYNITFRPSKKGLVFWVNTAIASVFSLLAVLGSISAVRQVALDAKTYKLFANV